MPYTQTMKTKHREEPGGDHKKFEDKPQVHEKRPLLALLILSPLWLERTRTREEEVSSRSETFLLFSEQEGD